MVVLPAHKGNAMVVMNTVDNKNKITALLENRTYRRVRNLTTWIKKNIMNLMKSSTTTPEDIKKTLTVTKHHYFMVYQKCTNRLSRYSQQ